MEEKEFTSLIDELEVYARAQPAAYKIRVALLAALGYLFLFAVLALVLLLVVGVIFAGLINYVVIKLLIIPLGMAAVVLRSMWVQFPEPEGVELSPADAPKLFALAKEVGQATRGPRLHKILLTGDLNAGIVQRPRLGMLGWQMNYLVVGLPLLQALSPEAVRAVIAHEFGHLSGNHGRFSGWIYRVRQTWIQVLSNMQASRRYGTGLFVRFFNWYAPYFAAYSFVFARAQEYEADRWSVELTGAQVAARALIDLELKDRLLSQEFLPTLYGQADLLPEPPDRAFESMLDCLREPVASDKAQLWFQEALQKQHSYDDTHPSLAARLAFLGFTEVGKETTVGDFRANESHKHSAENLIERVPEDFIAGRNRKWKERVRPMWLERHAFVNTAAQGLVELEEKAKSGWLTVEERWDRARFIAGTKGSQEAIPALRDVLEINPEHAAANYSLGDALLQLGDESGIKHLELAMEKDLSAVPQACSLIYNFLVARDRQQEAQKYEQGIKDYYAELERAQQERAHITTKDEFVPHDLPLEAVTALRQQLASYPHLKKAFLVRKVVKHFTDTPQYILGVIPNFPWYRYKPGNAEKELVKKLAQEVTYAGYTYVMSLENENKGFKRKFKKVKDAEVYPR